MSSSKPINPLGVSGILASNLPCFCKRELQCAQTIGYIVASDDGQIEMSKIVQAKTQNSSVSDFAAQMIRVHDDRTAQLLAIAKEAGIRSSASSSITSIIGRADREGS